VVIDHNLTEEHSAESAQRNLSFLLDEYEKDGDKTDPRTLYYIANTLTEMRKFEEAIPFFTKHIKQCGWPEEKYFSTHFLAQCLHLLGRTDEAITVALSATKIIPKWSLAYFDLAQFYSDTGQSANVIEWTLTGLAKEQPQPQDYFINDLDYTLFPMGRLADAYMQTGEFEEAYKIAARLRKEYPKDPRVEELYKTSKIVNADENFVKSFITVALRVRSTDRIKATKLFEALPMDLDGDIRLQQVRTLCLPPKTWDDNSIVIFCGKGNGEEWSPASVHTGIGGSEEAVIHMSQELTKLGYKVTVYNSCGTQRGMYKGVEYLPYYFFSEKDIYNTVIAWRNPGLMGLDFKAKKKIVWLHDIAYPQQFSPESIENTDTFIFLSKWHRNNVPEIPEEKCFISNNGIDLSQFKDIDIKAKKGLFWGSSYDRGLLCLVRDIMPLIHKELPDVTLDVCYGWDNIDRELSFIPSLAALRQELTPLLEQDYITHHGRVGHQQVADLMKKAQVMPYSSEFGETNMITSQKAQAAQTWVVMPEDAGGAPERVKYGAVIPRGSIYTDKETQKLFAEEVIRVLRADTFGDFDASEFSWTETAKTWQEIL
jgi:tetratricopeptide (TPR) repeat protein